MSNSSVSQIAQDLLELSKQLEGVRTSSRISGFNGSTTNTIGGGGANASSLILNTVLSANNPSYLSEVEQAVLRSKNPIDSSETEQLSINGATGLWLNKNEQVNFKGPIPIEDYPIHQDSNPEIITKTSQQTLEYIQELAIRYLRPPTPPAPGEIVINQEPNTLTAPAPPIIIRQQPARPDTPEPLVVREAPPQPPAQVGRKVITISGKKLPPPPRKVIIERLAPLPSKPQSVIIERWLPYSEVKRRVIFNRNTQPDPVVVQPRNVIVQWEAPEVKIRKEYKYLGVARANPVEYVQRYGQSLVVSNQLPNFVKEIDTPDGLVLAANHLSSDVHELEGDLEALKLIDLDREGLGAYKAYLKQFGLFNASQSAVGSQRLIGSAALSTPYNLSSSALSQQHSQSAAVASSPAATSSIATSASAQLNDLVEVLFKQIDINNSGSISVEEAEKLVLKLNSRLGRSYGEDDVRAFFSALDFNNDGSLSLDEFRAAFLNLAV